MNDKDVTKLLAKVFNENAAVNIVQDFHIMSKMSKLKHDPKMMELCKLWFALGHVNSMDKDSHFIKDYNGPGSNRETH